MAGGQTNSSWHDPSSPHPNSGNVRLALQQILSSPEFRASKRCQDFLSYVVEATIEGRGDSLKERTIGVDVFARPSSYDPSDDATVRVKAGEVRKRLSLYYATEGSSDRIRIDLPPGSYMPHFRMVEPQSAPEPVPVPITPRRSRRNLSPLAIALLAIALLVAVLSWRKLHVAPTLLDQFWAPVLEGSNPVSLCVAFVPVYAGVGEAAAAPSPKPENLTLVTDQFVGGGDLMAVSRLSSMLTGKQRPYHVLMGGNVSFHNLRTGPSILIGYSYTRWRSISKELRYFIDISRPPIGITDNGRPTSWNLPHLGSDRHTDEDYALVSRVFHPDTGAMLVEVAGITQYGTEAAADMIADPAMLVEALKGAPDGWQKKNLQLVLHVKVISGTPAPPTVVAKYFW